MEPSEQRRRSGGQRSLELIVTDAAQLEHGGNFDRLIPDPLSDWSWIVVLKDGGTAPIQIVCLRP